MDDEQIKLKNELAFYLAIKIKDENVWKSLLTAYPEFCITLRKVINVLSNEEFPIKRRKPYWLLINDIEKLNLVATREENVDYFILSLMQLLHAGSIKAALNRNPDFVLIVESLLSMSVSEIVPHSTFLLKFIKDSQKTTLSKDIKDLLNKPINEIGGLLSADISLRKAIKRALVEKHAHNGSFLLSDADFALLCSVNNAILAKSEKDLNLLQDISVFLIISGRMNEDQERSILDQVLELKTTFETKKFDCTKEERDTIIEKVRNMLKYTPSGKTQLIISQYFPNVGFKKLKRQIQ
jgi:hypothetical protein